MMKRLLAGCALAVGLAGTALASPPVSICDLQGKNCLVINSDGSINVSGGGGGGGAVYGQNGTSAMSSGNPFAVVPGSAGFSIGNSGFNALQGGNASSPTNPFFFGFSGTAASGVTNPGVGDEGFFSGIYSAVTSPIPGQPTKGVDIGATEQVQVTPAAGTVSTVTTGGTAVTVITGPILGGFVYNPPNAASEGIGTAENAYVDSVASPGSTDAAANGTTTLLAPGQGFNLTALAAGVTVKVNAATSGHKLTVNKW